MKKYALIILSTIMLSGTVFAAGSVLDNSIEYGRRGASGLVDEEDLTDEFYYLRFNTRFTHEYRKDTSFYAKYQYYNKDYDNSENLDNTFNAEGFGFDVPLYSANDIYIKTGPDLEYKEKTYSDAKNNDYEQIKFDLPIIIKKEDDWRVRITAGINNYHYPNAPKDQLKLSSRTDLSKKLFDGRLETSGFYKYQYIFRQKLAHRIENSYGVSFDYDISNVVIKSIGAGVEQGMDNTIIYEEREDSYDYKYSSWFIKTTHHLFDRLKAAIKYTDMNRTYADFDHNFEGFMIDNAWDLKIFEDKQYTANILANYLHKQFRYPYVSSPFAFHDNNVLAEMCIVKKDDWKIGVGSEVKFYDYPAVRTKDKIYYIEKFSFDKYLLKKDLILGFDYKHTYKNYLHKPAILENAFKFRATCRF